MPSVVDVEGRELEALRALAPLDGARVLEIGCGDGRLTRRYAPLVASVVALDPNEEEIETARATPVPGVEFHAADVREFDGPAGEFDLALFAWSL